MRMEDLFFLTAQEGIVLVNPDNLEMLAVPNENIKNAIDVIKSDMPNESLEIFKKPLTENDFENAKIEGTYEIGIMLTHKCKKGYI